MKKPKWRTRTKGTSRQKGVHFIIDSTSTQTKKVRLPKVTPRDLNVSVTVNLSKDIRERKKKAEAAIKKPIEEEPLHVLDPRTHPLRIQQYEERLAQEKAQEQAVASKEAGKIAEGTKVEVGSIHMGGERQPSAMEETGKLLETASGVMEKGAKRARANRAERREEKRYQESKAERQKEKAQKEREEALKREEKWKKEQAEKKAREDIQHKKKEAMDKWIKKADKHSYTKEAQKVAQKAKAKK